jgi:hypothetical protein
MTLYFMHFPLIYLLPITSKREVRQKFIIALKNILYTSMHHNLCDTIVSDTNTLTQLILDCTALVYIPHSLHIPIENIRRTSISLEQMTKMFMVFISAITQRPVRCNLIFIKFMTIWL